MRVVLLEFKGWPVITKQLHTYILDLLKHQLLAVLESWWVLDDDTGTVSQECKVSSKLVMCSTALSENSWITCSCSMVVMRFLRRLNIDINTNGSWAFVVALRSCGIISCWDIFVCFDLVYWTVVEDVFNVDVEGYINGRTWWGSHDSCALVENLWLLFYVVLWCCGSIVDGTWLLSVGFWFIARCYLSLFKFKERSHRSYLDRSKWRIIDLVQVVIPM